MGAVTKPNKYKDLHGWFDYEDTYKSVFDSLTDNAHIVEVGCWLGKSACYMAELIKGQNKKVRFDCVDIWRVPVNSGLHHVISGNKSSQVHDFVNNLNNAGVLDLVNVIQLPSLEVVNIYPDKSLDFVFLDNDHSEAHVYEELEAWWPKIKKGGILAGHDYIESSWPGVVNAVKRFGKKRRKVHEIQQNSFLFNK